MVKLKIELQNNQKVLITEVDSFNAKDFFNEIQAIDGSLIPIGSIIVNKHHIECITEITE